MYDSWWILLVGFLTVTSLVFLSGLIMNTRGSRLQSRLYELSEQQSSVLDQNATSALRRLMRSTVPELGKHLVPENNDERTRLTTRLIHAGLYSPRAMSVFLGVKVLLILTPLLTGVLASAINICPINYALLVGGGGSVIGIIAPSAWLDRKKTARQTALQRSLPDTLDLIVICMEGGLSLTASLQRVVDELQTAHRELTFELEIALREAQLGRGIGEALQNFAVRSDLEDLRNLSSTVISAEKFGASMASSLRAFSNKLRNERKQRAEEAAQKAGTKVLFPTLLFIFPAIFLIILGPAGIKIVSVLAEVRR